MRRRVYGIPDINSLVDVCRSMQQRGQVNPGSGLWREADQVAFDYLHPAIMGEWIETVRCGGSARSEQ